MRAVERAARRLARCRRMGRRRARRDRSTPVVGRRAARRRRRRAAPARRVPRPSSAAAIRRGRRSSPTTARRSATARRRRRSAPSAVDADHLRSRPWSCTTPPSGSRSPTRFPTHTAVVHGDVDPDVGGVRRAGRPPGRGVLRGRPRPRLQGRAVPVQRQRVPRGAVRRVQDARRAGQRQLPLPRRGAVVPARQRRRRGVRVPFVARRPSRPGRRSPAEAQAADRGRRRCCRPASPARSRTRR